MYAWKIQLVQVYEYVCMWLCGICHLELCEWVWSKCSLFVSADGLAPGGVRSSADIMCIAHVRQETKPSLVQIMACRLIWAKNSILSIELLVQISVRCDPKYNNFHIRKFVWKCRLLVNWASICSDNGSSPDRFWTITWANAAVLLIGPSGIAFSEIWIEIQQFSSNEINLNMSYVKCCPSCLGSLCLLSSVMVSHSLMPQKSWSFSSQILCLPNYRATHVVLSGAAE